MYREYLKRLISFIIAPIVALIISSPPEFYELHDDVLLDACTRIKICQKNFAPGPKFLQKYWFWTNIFLKILVMLCTIRVFHTVRVWYIPYAYTHMVQPYAYGMASCTL